MPRDKRCTIDKRLLSGYIDSELSHSERLFVEEHAKTCAECRRGLGELKNLESSFNVLSGMPEAVLPDNFASMVIHRIGKTKPSAYVFGALRRIPVKKAAIFAGAAAILILFFFNLSTLTTPFMIRPYSAIIGSYEGNVIINGGIPERKTLGNGDIIETHKDAMLSFLVSHGMRLVLRANSRLEVARLSINKQSGSIKARLVLKKGSLLVDKSAAGQMLKLNIKTPQALIRPVGTEFLVSVYGGSTSLYVKEGRVELLSPANPEEALTIGPIEKALADSSGMLKGPFAIVGDELTLFGEETDIEEEKEVEGKPQLPAKQELKKIYYEVE